MKIKFYIIFLMIICVSACKKSNPNETFSPFTENPIFPGSMKIDVPSYTYFYSKGKIIHVKGDLSTITNFDTVPTMPSFAWKSTGLSLVTLAIFDGRILTSSGNITNKEDIVWIWNTGLGTGKEGSVSFSDGRDFVNGKIASSTPTPLDTNSFYTWAVWAWDEQGEKITHSTKELGFYVGFH